MRELYIRFSLHKMRYILPMVLLLLRIFVGVGCWLVLLMLLAPLHPFVSQSNKFWSYRTWLYGVRSRAPLTREINETLIYVKWAYDTSLSLVVGTRANLFWGNCKITIRAMFFFFGLLFLFFPLSNLQFADCLTSWTMSFLNLILLASFRLAS